MFGMNVSVPWYSTNLSVLVTSSLSSPLTFSPPSPSRRRWCACCGAPRPACAETPGAWPLFSRRPICASKRTRDPASSTSVARGVLGRRGKQGRLTFINSPNIATQGLPWKGSWCLPVSCTKCSLGTSPPPCPLFLFSVTRKALREGVPSRQEPDMPLPIIFYLHNVVGQRLRAVQQVHASLRLLSVHGEVELVGVFHGRLELEGLHAIPLLAVVARPEYWFWVNGRKAEEVEGRSLPAASMTMSSVRQNRVESSTRLVSLSLRATSAKTASVCRVIVRARGPDLLSSKFDW